MEVRRLQGTAYEFADLQERLKRATTLPRKRGPQKNQSLRNVTDRQLNYLPVYKVQDADIPGIETFVVFLEKMKSFKLADKKTVADRYLAQALNLARKLDYELPGNDGAVKFFYEGTRYLEEVNPGLAEDAAKVIQKAWDEKRFNDKLPYRF